jgi:hypothetical protein
MNEEFELEMENKIAELRDDHHVYVSFASLPYLIKRLDHPCHVMWIADEGLFEIWL